MDEIHENIKKNTRILLARNTPVALVVGAASFFGSNLVDKLLLKDIQVIGVDDLIYGDRKNLSHAVADKNFHFVIQEIEKLNLEVDRLDYIFLVPQQNINLTQVLQLFRKLKPRLLLISSVELYDEAVADNFSWLREIESKVAKSAKEDNVNARILRLGSVFGPRMSFEQPLGGVDPTIRLIQQSLTGDLQKDISLEFSSRAIYIDDACDLAIKCILSGATAQKIFDGVLPNPIKVAEIKQVLLDPVWYENKNFIPTELPPWTTPNLEKTIKFLNWHPRPHLVEHLKKTLNYFKNNEIKVPRVEVEQVIRANSKNENSDIKKHEQREWKIEKAKELETLKRGQEKNNKEPIIKENKRIKKGIGKIVSVLVVVFIGYALIWPLFQIGWGVLTFRFQLQQAASSLQKGDFEKSLSSIDQASGGINQAEYVFHSLEPVRKLGLLKSQFELGDNLGNLAILSSDAAQNTVLGTQALYQSLKSITGELSDSPKDNLELAKTYLSSADEDLSKADALINNQDFKSNLPEILKSRVESLSERLLIYSNLVKRARALSILLPEVVALEGNKDYLVLLQNNNELRPTGGFIGSFANVSFENGKLKKLEVNDTYAIDGQLNIHVEPPKEIKTDLNQKDYFLRDSNFEPDFPTSARQAEWFYTKETGKRVGGVIALDISAMENLLSTLGSLDLPDYNEKVSADNLFEKAISHAEVNFFPGTQAKKSFLTALTTSLLNKLFFLPNQNWPGIVTSLGKSLENKHMSIYLDDPKLFSYIISQNWGGVLPRAGANDKSMSDFLAPVEANLGADKANFYLDRKYNLETVIGKDGEITHRLRIAYINRSPSDTFPAGKYKNRMRVYLPMGTKLNRALWGESDITSSVESFVDYGRTGYSMLLELAPKQQKTLVLDYQTPLKLEFKANKASYRLDVIKQSGTLKDPFIWSVTFPINMKLSSSESQKIGPQEQIIRTDLSTDKTFELQFSRP